MANNFAEVPDNSWCTFISHVMLFAALYVGLIFSSGGMILLGAFLLRQKQLSGYEAYQSSEGFQTGLLSAFFWQWITAAVMLIFGRVANGLQDNPVWKKIIAQMTVFVFSSGVFSFLHHQQLPGAQKLAYQCGKHLLGEAEKHPVCSETDFSHLYASLFTGFGVAMSGVLAIYCLVYLPCLCLRVSALDNSNEHANQDNAQPVLVVPQVIVPMQARPNPLQLESSTEAHFAGMAL